MEQENGMSNMDGVSDVNAGIGRLLREAREARGLTVDDVASRIKFAARQIEWLENDDFSRLPEAAFVRGFVRSYSRMLGLDTADLLSRLPSSHVQPVQKKEISPVDVPLPTAISMRKHNILWLVAALVVAISLALFERMQGKSGDAPESANGKLVQNIELPPGNALEQAAQSQPVSAQDMSRQPSVSPQPAQAIAVTPATMAAPAAVQAPAIVPSPVLKSSPPVQPAVQAVVPSPVLKSAPPAQAIEKQPVKPATAATQPVSAQAARKEKEKVNSQHSQQQTAQWKSFQPFLMQPSSKPQLVDKPEHTRPVAPRPVKPAVSKSAPVVVPKLAPTAVMVPAVAAASAPAGSPALPTLAEGEHSLRFEFEDNAWIEVKDESGNILLSKMNTPGSLARVRVKGALTAIVGNAHAVRMFDNGRPVNLAPYLNGDVAHVNLK